MNIIVVNNLDLIYEDKKSAGGGNRALKNINMEIKKGEITALIGPSGCGKSTFLRCINRMNDIIEGCKITGEIIFNDQNIYDKDVDVMSVRKHIGMVFQKPNPFPMSVYDNVAYAPRYHKVSRRVELDNIVEKSLRAANLWEEVKDRLKKPALSLSGGQQQRLCIARAIALEPEILLMDEATSALDPISTYKIEDLMQELKKTYTVIIVTHNMQQAARVADRTAFFLLGDLIEMDKTDAIFSFPSQPKTLEYVSGRFG
ncbi:MAG: phosphate ABC transporter ATP-binding protein PstB [Oscillospiraceae bacterium]|jgi:phosphate transport system ATP-binding protein|nr:phosphate ABC transporter ATP-binding protein PstB [Oscillospiraceae bacterium]